MHQEQSLMEGYCPRPCFFFAWLFFISLSLSSEGSWLCLGIIYWHVVPTPLFFFFSSSPPHSSHYSLSFTISAAFHHPSPASTNIHPSPPLSALNLCLPFPLSPPFSLPASALFSVALHPPPPSLNVTSIFSSLQYNFLSSSLLLPSHNPLLKTPQPCRPLQGWTTRWSEGWWLLSSSSCSASSSSSGDTSSDTKVNCPHA